MNTLPQQRFAAGEEAGVGAQLFGLRQHPVHLLVGQALLMAVLCGPAAGAVHVAGGGGIHQDELGYIDVIFLGGLLRCLVDPEAAFVGCVG